MVEIMEKAGDKGHFRHFIIKRAISKGSQILQGLIKSLKSILATKKSIYLCQMVKHLEIVLYGYG